MERQHAHHPALVDDHERTEVLVGHREDRVHRAAGRLDREKPVALYAQDFLDLHGAVSRVLGIAYILVQS